MLHLAPSRPVAEFTQERCRKISSDQRTSPHIDTPISRSQTINTIANLPSLKPDFPMVKRAATKPPQQHCLVHSMTSCAQKPGLQQVCSKLPVQEPAGNMLAREPQKPGQLTPQFTLPHPRLRPELRVCLQIQPMAGNLQSSAKPSFTKPT
jgi:hypothetical protein